MRCQLSGEPWRLAAARGVSQEGEEGSEKHGGRWGEAAAGTRDRGAAGPRIAAQTGDKYDELLSEGARHASKDDWRKAARTYREAIALKPEEPEAYANLGAALKNSGHDVEAAQRYLEAKERYPVGSVDWAEATAQAFRMLQLEECDEVPKPGWWNDEELKALSARVLRAAPNGEAALDMRAMVLSGDDGGAWAVGPRSAAEFKEAAAHFDRSAALCHAPAWKTESFRLADQCRSLAESL